MNKEKMITEPSPGHLEIRGSYKGKDGCFQFIKEQNGEINHRLFVPYKK